jgi:hypothetical protein
MIGNIKKSSVQEPLMAPPAGFGDSPEHVTFKKLPGKLISSSISFILWSRVTKTFF